MTDQAGKHRTTLWASLAVGGSLLIHGLVLLLPGLRAPNPDARAGMDITLVVISSPTPEPASEQQPEVLEIVEAEPEPPQRQDPPVRLLTAEPDDSPNDLPAAPILSVPPTQLTGEQILATIRQNESWLEAPERSDTLKAAAVPALPGAPGWINDYVGTVTPSIDRWQGNDGSSATRTVLASGQIICGRTRPPTMAELFNPSFSTNIAPFWACGRERAEPVDRTDPWTRTPRPASEATYASE